ncbi:MAG: pentapeptide repeat-containing protein [Trichocoleus desertorum ATA4-8-CV12]|jgi:uncharacterized protein YjbI with pentapeptide repeats|nr:pentapeptide repeat-containing protein [Trichocoleus desertorum ATA4-8-CV12]
MQVQDLILRYQQGERDFAHVDLSGATLSGINLQDADLTGANLTGTNLSWALLNRANLTGACLRRADLRSTALSSATLVGAVLNGANLAKADLRLAQLQDADLNWATLPEGDLSGADLSRAKLDQINLEKAKLNGTQFVGAELMEANLRRASLISANLSQANLREAHLEEANLREAKLVGTNLIEANLSGAYLRQADLSQADMHRVTLIGADLSEAVLNNADLSRANLSGAYLLKTSCKKTYLLRATLQEVYLLQADLTEANLRGADLRRADLSGAYLNEATLSEADLSDAYLLESHLIRANLDGAQLTGCCIYNWHLEDSDLAKVECRYVFTQFNYTTKSPTERYPAARDFEPGELARQYQGDDAGVEVVWQEPPHWEALVFTLAQVEMECLDVHLTLKSYGLSDNGYLLKLTSDRPVNGKILAQRILQLYPELLPRVLSRRSEVLGLLGISPRMGTLEAAVSSPPPAQRSPTTTATDRDKRLRLYQEIVRQIQHILHSQAPDQFVGSVEHLLNYLRQQGISTEEIQKKLISQVIVKRAQQNKAFLEHLKHWDQTADESARLSSVGEAVRLAIALL